MQIYVRYSAKFAAQNFRLGGWVAGWLGVPTVQNTSKNILMLIIYQLSYPSEISGVILGMGENTHKTVHIYIPESICFIKYMSRHIYNFSQIWPRVISGRVRAHFCRHLRVHPTFFSSLLLGNFNFSLFNS